MNAQALEVSPLEVGTVLQWGLSRLVRVTWLYTRAPHGFRHSPAPMLRVG